MDWFQVLLVSIPGLLAFAGMIYNEYRKRRNAQEDAKSTAEMRREPTWPELVEENRNLRADLTSQEKRYRDLDERVGRLEDEKELMERAAKSILYGTYAQWPPDHPAPVFGQEDLDAVPHLIHPAWRFNYRPA